MNATLLCLLAALAAPALAAPALDPDALAAWNVERVELTRAGMWTLAGWGAASVGVGLAGRLASDDRRWQSFHLMTAGWGAVDLALAIGGMWGLDPATAAALGPAESLAEQLFIERALLFNAGLDVGWLGLGAWLWERGLRKADARLEGFGQAIVIQGGFLLVFDLSLYLLEAAHGDALRVMLVPGGAAVGGVF